MPACEKCGWDPSAVAFKPYDNAMNHYTNTFTGARAVMRGSEDELMVGPNGGTKVLWVLSSKYLEWVSTHSVAAQVGSGPVPALVNPQAPSAVTFDAGTQSVPVSTTQTFGPAATLSEDKVTVVTPGGVLIQKPLSQVESPVATPAVAGQSTSSGLAAFDDPKKGVS